MIPLTHSIYLLGQAIGASAEKLLRDEFGFGFVDYLVLHGVGKKKLTHQAALAPLVGVGVTGLSRAIRRLADQGYLTADENPKNRRRSQLSLTAKGRAELRKSTEFLERRFHGIASKVARPDDVAAFERVINSLLTSMERVR